MPSKLVHDAAAVASMHGRGDVVVPVSKRVFTVALTGGPCSGKSSSLQAFTRELTGLGFDVYSVPEVPTIILNAGFPYPGLDGACLQPFEDVIARTQLLLENELIQLARTRDEIERKRPAVVFFDRGLLDLKAYCAPAVWAAVLAAIDLDEAAVRARYDLVVHLETAAFGAEAFYTTENNAARTEGIEEARVNDTRVRSAWEGHPNWKCVPNRPGAHFSEKIKEAVGHVLSLIKPGGA